MKIETKSIIDIFEDVVDSLRKTNVITNISLESGNYYTIDFQNSNEYAVDDYLTLTTDLSENFTKCKVTAINSDNQITVLNLDKTDLSLSTSSKSNAPYYDFTNWKSEANELTEKDNAPKYKQQKYPLIYLLLNIKESRDNQAYHSSIDNVNLYLVVPTDKVKSDEWRHNNTFPTLRALYDELIEAIKSNKNILIDGNFISHDYEEIFFMGKEDRNQNKLNDYVDCIHLQFANLRTKNKNGC